MARRVGRRLGATRAQGAYGGRLRKLRDLPFAASVEAYSAEHPRPVFATAAAVRAGFATNKVTTVSADPIAVADQDRVAFDVIDQNTAVVAVSFNERFPSEQAWATALAAAKVSILGTSAADAEHARFSVTAEPGLTSKLETATLWAARVEPVTHHHDTTWGALRGSSPAGFVVGGATIPDAQLDLIGLYVRARRSRPTRTR